MGGGVHGAPVWLVMTGAISGEHLNSLLGQVCLPSICTGVLVYADGRESVRVDGRVGGWAAGVAGVVETWQRATHGD